MKKIYSMWMIVVLSLSLCGCGSTMQSKSKTMSNEEKKIAALEAANKKEYSDIPEKLDDAYYQKRWPGKKILTWLKGDKLESKIIVALNDALVEEGCDYVIQYKTKIDYAEFGHSVTFESIKEQDQAADILQLESTDGRDDTNKYKEAVDQGLLEPLEDYLQQNEKGKEFYNKFHKIQWDSYNVNGHIYSYDWRTQPLMDDCIYINQKYVDKYHIDTSAVSIGKLFSIARKESKESKSNYLYPIIWGKNSYDIDKIEDQNLLDLFKKNSDIVSFQESMDWDKGIDKKTGKNKLDFVLYFGIEYFIDGSDSQVIIPDINATRINTKRISIKKDSYEPVTNGLTAVASWSKNKEDAKDFLAMININPKIANILQYGIEGINYRLKNGRVVFNEEERYALLMFGPQNKRITYPMDLEPDNKEEAYKEYMEKHLN